MSFSVFHPSPDHLLSKKSPPKTGIKKDSTKQRKTEFQKQVTITTPRICIWKMNNGLLKNYLQKKTDSNSLSTEKSFLFVHLRRLKIINNYPDFGKPMGYLEDVEGMLEEDESCAFVIGYRQLKLLDSAVIP
jgi:Ulp1 family protease